MLVSFWDTVADFQVLFQGVQVHIRIGNGRVNSPQKSAEFQWCQKGWLGAWTKSVVEMIGILWDRKYICAQPNVTTSHDSLEAGDVMRSLVTNWWMVLYPKVSMALMSQEISFCNLSFTQELLLSLHTSVNCKPKSKEETILLRIISSNSIELHLNFVTDV